MNNRPLEKSRRVLIIDDNRAIHSDFRKILTPPPSQSAELDASERAVYGGSSDLAPHTQFEVDSAYQGQEGVLLVKKALEAGRPYAMAFVDVRMPPGWDGIETTRRIWEIDAEIQIVICTAYADYSWDEMFEKLGNRDGLLILKKPFDAVEAFQLAHALTEKWRLHQQSQRKMKELEVSVAERTGELVQSNVALRAEIAERRKTMEELRESERRFSDMLRHLEMASLMLDQRARITYCNDYLLRLTGWKREEVIGRDWFETFLPAELVEGMRGVYTLLLADRPDAWHHENEILTRAGARRLIRWSNSVCRSVSGEVIGTASIGEDITERTRLEAQSYQTQKMETVGKLAGGVAHEFNSILTVIIGQSESLLRDLPAGSPLAINAAAITTAADRAAALTRNLLAYGRKQFLRPQSLDLNQVIAGMKDLFQHLMGVDVLTQIIPAPDLRLVKADAGQIEQVIMNMLMNARDAMPNGGRLTLETANVSFDEESVGRYSELKPGDYVMLAITDTGTGMSEAVKALAFDPFFTTKEVGQGTGLGLSTCYGIIKQSGGHISLYSELSRGTTFKIYLPQVGREGRQSLRPPGLTDLPRGTETILLVEDDAVLREMSVNLLKRLGYTVLAATNGLEALSLKQQPGTGHVDLLFTDVVMPHMSGRELSERVHLLYPHTKILFTSAYTINAIVEQRMLDLDVALLLKPFTPSALAAKVREVLDQPAAQRPDTEPNNMAVAK